MFKSIPYRVTLINTLFRHGTMHSCDYDLLPQNIFCYFCLSAQLTPLVIDAESKLAVNLHRDGRFFTIVLSLGVDAAIYRNVADTAISLRTQC